MWGGGRKRTGSGMCALWRLGGLMTLVSIFAAASPQPLSAQAVTPASKMPDSCLKQPSEKIAGLLESLHDHPTTGAWNTLGVLYAQANQLSCAIPALENAIRLSAADWEPHYNLALALLRQGERTAAKRELQTAIRLKPDSVSSHFALGSLLREGGKLAAASAEFRAALNLDSTFTPAALQLSQVLLAEGHPQAAIACLEEANRQKLSPAQSESVQAALAMAYVQNGDWGQGLAILEVLIASQPEAADPQFRLGQLYARRNQSSDQESAAAHFREALRLDPDLDDARIELARSLLSRHNDAEALPLLQECVARDPGSAQGFYLMGLAHEGLGQTQAATNALRKAVSLDPKDAQARHRLGTLLARAGRNAEALSQLQMAERLAPLDPQLHQERAALLEQTGNQAAARQERAQAAALEAEAKQEAVLAKLTDQANHDLSAGQAQAAAGGYRKALQARPNDPRLHYNLALALDQMGDVASERKELQRAVALDNSFADAQNQLALLALKGGDLDDAEQRFKKALAVDPNYAEAAGNLAIVYSERGNDADAAHWLQEALRLDPKYAKAYLNLGLLLARKGAFADAEQQLRNAIQIDPAYADAYAALGMVQAKTGRNSDAVGSFRRALALDPNSAQAHLNLGIALVDNYDRSAGLKEFSEALRLDPQLAAAHSNLGRFYYETGKYPDAQQELETALRLEPDSAEALYFLALTERQLGALERSSQLLKKLVQLQPGNADAQFLLGQNLEREGNPTGAVEHWQLALEADPDHSQALYSLAKALKKLGNPEAQKYQDRFDALQKNQQITDRVQELGNFALEAANAQNWPQAIELMTEAIQLCGSCPQGAHLHRNLGLFYGRTGKIEEAKAQLHTALELDPHDADAQKALSVLEGPQAAQAK